jgi:hypothetical protein
MLTVNANFRMRYLKSTKEIAVNVHFMLMKKAGYPPLIHQFSQLYACNLIKGGDAKLCTYQRENSNYISCDCVESGMSAASANLFEFNGEMPL